MLEKGNKVGLWEYFAYTRDGRQVTVQKYDHTTKKLVFFRPVEDIMYSTELKPAFSSVRTDGSNFIVTVPPVGTRSPS